MEVINKLDGKNAKITTFFLCVSRWVQGRGDIFVLYCIVFVLL